MNKFRVYSITSTSPRLANNAPGICDCDWFSCACVLKLTRILVLFASSTQCTCRRRDPPPQVTEHGPHSSTCHLKTRCEKKTSCYLHAKFTSYIISTGIFLSPASSGGALSWHTPTTTHTCAKFEIFALRANAVSRFFDKFSFRVGNIEFLM